MTKKKPLAEAAQPTLLSTPVPPIAINPHRGIEIPGVSRDEPCPLCGLVPAGAEVIECLRIDGDGEARKLLFKHESGALITIEIPATARGSKVLEPLQVGQRFYFRLDYCHEDDPQHPYQLTEEQYKRWERGSGWRDTE